MSARKNRRIGNSKSELGCAGLKTIGGERRTAAMSSSTANKPSDPCNEIAPLAMSKS